MRVNRLRHEGHGQVEWKHERYATLRLYITFFQPPNAALRHGTSRA